MKLSRQDKEELNDYYKDRDLYNPSKAPEQETTNFQPKPPQDGKDHLWGGGCAEGMAEGGEAGLGPIPGLDSFSAPSVSGGTETAKAQEPGMDVPQDMKDVPIGAVLAGISGAVDLGKTIFGDKAEPTPPAQPAPPAVPASTPPAAPKGNLGPDQYDELINFLKAKPSFGQNAMTGLAGLADAIETGVARAPGSNFQKNMLETQQQQKKNLIDALREKYDVGFKGKALEAENTRAANTLAGENERAKLGRETEKERTAAELAVRAQEAQANRAQSGIEAAAKLPSTGFLHPSTWGRGDEVESVRQQLLQSGAKPGQGPVVVKTTQEWAALPKGTHYVDAKGKPGIKR